MSDKPTGKVIQLTPQQIEREKGRVIAMRENLKRRKTYQRAVKTMEERMNQYILLEDRAIPQTKPSNNNL